jgi:hypothetical protein
MKKLVAVALFLLLVLVLTTPADASTISITVGGWTQQFPAPTTPPADAPWGPNGYPGDTVTLESVIFTLDLTPGTVTKKINTLLWTIDYTYGGTATDPDAWSDLLFAISAPRTITSGAATGTLSQAGQLQCTWDNDFLSLDAGSTDGVFIVQGFRVDIKPRALPQEGGSSFSGDAPWSQPSRDVLADVTVSAVPDSGATLLLMGCALTGLGALRRKLGA